MAYRTGTVNSATIGAAAATFVGADNHRRALRLFANSTNRVTISDSPSVVLDGGINLPAGTSQLVLTYEIDGDLVQKRLFAIAAGAGTVIGYVESREEGP
jgi:hypothetical protein